MCLCTIAAEYNEPLQAAHAHIDDYRYVTGICGAAMLPKLDLSDQLQRRGITSASSIRLRSADVFVYYRRRV